MLAPSKSLPMPDSPSAFLEAGRSFWANIQEIKRNNSLPDAAWYPFDTLSCLDTVTTLLTSDFADVMKSITSMPVADIGCGDGDFSLFLKHLGADVDAIDSLPTNYNRMKGVAALARLANLNIRAIDLDLNSTFRLPRDVYGLAVFLGTLYHLKNPYGILENLAYQAQWCILSTRVAQITPRSRANVENEPVAYLADGREMDNDATNYWVFSPSGLLRILQRTRWAIAATQRVGCSDDSDPINPNADERMFVLAKSRVHFPDLQVRLLNGWHAIEHNFRWTAKSFSIEVVLPLETLVSSFSLAILVPAQAVAEGQSLGITCSINGQRAGTNCYTSPGLFLFRGELPPFALHEPILRLEFSVESEFSPPGGDVRELGIPVPVSEEGAIDFRVS